MKLIIITIIVSLSYVAAEYHITSENITHITNGSFYDSTVLKTLNQLIYISYPKENADVKIKLESKAISDEKNNTCEFSIPVPANRNFLKPKAKVLGNGKLVVAFAETDLENPEKGAETFIRVYIIDVDNNCANTTFTIPFDTGVVLSYKQFSIIPYQDSFDIFAKSFLHCKPPGSICLTRYNLKGDLQDTFNFDFNTSDNGFDLVDIYPLKAYDPSSGYIFFSQHSTTLKTLDANLKVTKERKFDGFILSYSVLNDDIGICFQIEDIESRTNCVKLDTRLKAKASVTLNDSPHFGSIRIYNLMDGSSLIAVINRGKIATIVRRLTVDGRISEREYYSYDCESLVTNPLDNFVELKGNVYCFNFECKYEMITHCPSPSEMEKLSLFT